MLEQLQIRNIALFDDALLAFGPGLTVLTGETGAGKSLVVDALSFLCGGKADKGLIRTGSDKAIVEGIFDLSGVSEVQQILLDADIQTEGDKLLLYREIQQSGRSVCRVEGVPVSLSTLREISACLVDLHGQHEHQSLLKDGQQLHYLDLMGDEGYQHILREVAVLFSQMKHAQIQYQDAQRDWEQRQERLESLTLRKNELQQAKLVPGEEESLVQNRLLLRNADKITKALQSALEMISESTSNQDTAFSLQRQAARALSGISDISPDYQQIAERTDSLSYEIEELGHDINHLMNQVETDQGRLEEVEARLDLLRKLGRKHGATVEEMLQTLESTKQEIQRLNQLENLLDELQQAHLATVKQYMKKAEMLHISRLKLSEETARMIEQILHEVNMSGTSFAINLQKDVDKPTAIGIDTATMLISPNKGEPHKPMAKIASGGELSRVMLALKTLTAQKNEVPAMVFDEIDTGVSGMTAQVIAQKLWSIARYRQVICVTHLHQLAAMATSQLLVTKSEVDGRTKAQVKVLSEEDRVTEIASMLGDVKTQGISSLQHAKVLLQDAERFRVF